MKTKVRARFSVLAIVLALAVGGNAAAAPSSSDSWWGQLTKRARDFSVSLYHKLSPPLP